MTTKKIQTREIRVFLSSTFRDMNAERSYLVKEIFPKVRAACLAHQVGFIEIDLRWGVTEEEAKNGATVEICLKEIDRCREFPPFFIGFLGERYGWIPKHEDLSSYWGRNAESSYAGPIQDAVERGISVTELEIELAVLGQGAAAKIAGHALFLLRDPALTATLYNAEADQKPAEADFYDVGQGKLKSLKQRLRASRFMGLDNYTTIQAFGERIERYLLAQLEQYFPLEEAPSTFEQSNQAHETFSYHRLNAFLPREDVRLSLLGALEKRSECPALGCIMLTGPSGQGKSSLMADIAQHLKELPQYRVIDHYIGADKNNNLDAWVYRILQTLHPVIQDISGEIPVSIKGRSEALNSWLSIAAARQKSRYVLVLDALDQLSDGGKDLSLLKQEVIGGAATVICSAADGTLARTAAGEFETISVPPLTKELRSELIAATLRKYGKTLPTELTTQIAQTQQSGSPLFLTLSIEKLRLDARHETLGRLVSDVLELPDAQSLFLQCFLLDEDYGRPSQPNLASLFMALLGASQSGLSETEMADLLALPTDPKSEETGRPRLPQVYLSKLLSNFQRFLLHKKGFRAPMHRIFGEAALAHSDVAQVRERLYRYFKNGYGIEFGDAFDARRAGEALHQLTQLSRISGEALTRLNQDLSHLDLVRKMRDEAEEELFAALNLFDHVGKQRIAETWVNQLRAMTEDAISEQSESLYRFSCWLGDGLGSFNSARCIQETLLAYYLAILGEENPITLYFMGALSTTLYAIGDLKDAETLALTVLAAQRKTMSDEHSDTLMTVNNLALFHRYKGDPISLATAKESFEIVWEARKRIYGVEDPETLVAMGNLADTLSDQGELDIAKGLQEQVLNLRRRILGLEHPHTLDAMDALAVTLNRLCNPQGMEEMQALFEIYRSSLGENHPTTLNAKSQLISNMGESVGRNEARDLQRHSVEMSQRVLGHEHPRTLSRIRLLAIYLSDLGDEVDAKALREQLFDVSQRLLGVEHGATLNAMADLANSMSILGDEFAAKTLREQVLDVRQRLWGAEHWKTLEAMDHLAISYTKLSDFASAKDLFDQVMSAKRRLLGIGHRESQIAEYRFAQCIAAEMRSNLAKASTANDFKFSLALAVPDQSLLTQELGETHELVVAMGRLLINEVESIEDHVYAVKIFERLVPIIQFKQGISGPQVANAMNQLHLWRERLAKLQQQQVTSSVHAKQAETALGGKNPAGFFSRLLQRLFG